MTQPTPETAERIRHDARARVGENTRPHPWHVIDETIEAMLAAAMPSLDAVAMREALKKAVASYNGIASSHCPSWLAEARAALALPLAPGETL